MSEFVCQSGPNKGKLMRRVDFNQGVGSPKWRCVPVSDDDTSSLPSQSQVTEIRTQSRKTQNLLQLARMFEGSAQLLQEQGDAAFAENDLQKAEEFYLKASSFREKAEMKHREALTSDQVSSGLIILTPQLGQQRHRSLQSQSVRQSNSAKTSVQETKKALKLKTGKYKAHQRYLRFKKNRVMVKQET